MGQFQPGLIYGEFLFCSQCYNENATLLKSLVVGNKVDVESGNREKPINRVLGRQFHSQERCCM